MCQQKRLNMGREHSPGNIGVKSVKAGILDALCLFEVSGMSNVTIECTDIRWNTKGEGNLLKINRR